MKSIFLILSLSLLALCEEFNIDAILEDEAKEDTKKEIKAQKFVKDSNKEYKKLKSKFYKKYEYVPPSSKNSLSKKELYCFSNYIRDDGGKYFCLAFAKNDKKYCYYNELSQPLRNICLGYCYDSSLSKAQKAFCLAIKNNNQSYCFDMHLKGSLKAMCLGRFNKTNCFSINSEREKNICLGLSLN